MSKPSPMIQARYYTPTEHLPQEDTFVLTYSAPYGAYQIARWTSSRGWIDIGGSQLRCVTEWLDLPLPLPYDIRNSYDDELATKYGLEKKGIFG